MCFLFHVNYEDEAEAATASSCSPIPVKASAIDCKAPGATSLALSASTSAAIAVTFALIPEARVRSSVTVISKAPTLSASANNFERRKLNS